jgi:pimeloyl-ACP methyl ester carboxylesterase
MILLFFSLALHLVIYLSALTFLPSGSPNPCTMTYMNPFYRDLEADADSGYLLREYLEGGRGRAAGAAGAVLFVPGNSGSSEQARSLGHWLDEAAPKVRVFAVDFGEELSVLSGAVLARQAAWTNKALAAVRASVPGRPVVVVGHSMGGVVALSLPVSAGWASGQDLHILALSSPLYTEPVACDLAARLLYRRAWAHWGSDAARGSIVSLHGGHRDEQVRPGLAALWPVGPRVRSLVRVTESVQAMGVSADHRCVLWCVEIARPLAYALSAALASSADVFASLSGALAPKSVPKGTQLTAQQGDYSRNHLFLKTVSASVDDCPPDFRPLVVARIDSGPLGPEASVGAAPLPVRIHSSGPLHLAASAGPPGCKVTLALSTDALGTVWLWLRELGPSLPSRAAEALALTLVPLRHSLPLLLTVLAASLFLRDALNLVVGLAAATLLALPVYLALRRTPRVAAPLLLVVLQAPWLTAHALTGGALVLSDPPGLSLITALLCLARWSPDHPSLRSLPLLFSFVVAIGYPLEQGSTMWLASLLTAFSIANSVNGKGQSEKKQL